MADICIACIDDMCFECAQPTEDKCCCGGYHGIDPMLINLSGIKSHRLTMSDGGPAKLGRPFKKDDQLVDLLSAGRKRAAELAPIPSEYICEYSMLKYAGGGIEPIVGCSSNIATDRHHSPDKGTLTNTVGINLHRICSICHNRWHQLNDKHYGERPENNIDYMPLPETGECKPHDRHTQASPREVIRSNLFWKKPVLNRPPYRHWETTEEKDEVNTT